MHKSHQGWQDSSILRCHLSQRHCCAVKCCSYIPRSSVLTDKFLFRMLPWQGFFYLSIIYETLFSSTFTLSLHPFLLCLEMRPFLHQVFQKLQKGYLFRHLALVLKWRSPQWVWRYAVWVHQHLRCPKGRLLGKTLTEHEDCHDCTGRGLLSLCFSCRGCVFSMPSGFLTVHKGLFIHRQRMPAGVSTNQIMTLSAPAHWPAATTHMTPRGPRAMFCGKKCWIMNRTKKVLWLRRTVRWKGWECYNEANQLCPTRKANSAQGKTYFH